MTTHEFSYWLHVEPTNECFLLDEAVQIKATLEADEDIRWPSGPLVITVDTIRKFGRDVPIITGEVNPNQGTVPEDKCLYEHIAKVARRFIDWRFELRELDEEDKACQIYTEWLCGREHKRQYARVIPAEYDYDTKTITAVIKYLTNAGLGMSADRIRSAFLPPGL